MRTIRLPDSLPLPPAEADALAGTYLDERAYDHLVDDEDCDVLRPDGTPLLLYRANCLPPAACLAAYEALRHAATLTDNRGMAGGRLDLDADALAQTVDTGVGTPSGVGQRRNAPMGARTGTRWQAVKQDGTLDRTNRAREVRSGIVGYFDRYPRIPYCRTTAYNLAHPDRWRAAMPFLHAVDRVFATALPARHAAQLAAIRRTHPDFYVHGTTWTTITVNRNWQTAVHKDAGDYRPGFGVMCVLQAGRYRGANLVFPAWRVAVNMRTLGVCLADVHEWHGNTPIVGVPGHFERISTVLYYREAMWRCGSAAQELERAKRRQLGEPLWDD